MVLDLRGVWGLDEGAKYTTASGVCSTVATRMAGSGCTYPHRRVHQVVVHQLHLAWFKHCRQFPGLLQQVKAAKQHHQQQADRAADDAQQRPREAQGCSAGQSASFIASAHTKTALVKPPMCCS